MEPAPAPRCPAWRAASPQNPDCAWCERHAIHLDADGRFCARCRTHPPFRALLERHARLREAASCEGSGGWCERFGLRAGRELCARCRADPEYRAFLAGQRAARPRPRRVRPEDCPQRGGVLRVETQRCCGGRLKDVPVHACARRGEATRETCLLCDLGDGPENPGAPVREERP